MKTKEKPKTDILCNPFLAVTAEDCVHQFYKGNSTGNSSDYVIVPEYDFLIISETKTSKKIIVFDEAENYFENTTKEKIKEFFNWKQCCLWDGGALKLSIREEDPMYVDLILSPDREYTIRPNLARCAPFVYQILKHLEPFHSASPDEGFGFIEVCTKGLGAYSFKRLRGPIAVW